MTKQPTFKKLILDELKSRNWLAIVKKIKSIRSDYYSMGSSLYIKTDGLTKLEYMKLNTLVEKYRRGRFSGIDDTYEYKSMEFRNERALSYVIIEDISKGY